MTTTKRPSHEPDIHKLNKYRLREMEHHIAFQRETLELAREITKHLSATMTARAEVARLRHEDAERARRFQAEREERDRQWRIESEERDRRRHIENEERAARHARELAKVTTVASLGNVTIPASEGSASIQAQLVMAVIRSVLAIPRTTFELHVIRDYVRMAIEPLPLTDIDAMAEVIERDGLIQVVDVLRDRLCARPSECA
jgi:hypothetical protein